MEKKAAEIHACIRRKKMEESYDKPGAREGGERGLQMKRKRRGKG